MFMSRFIRTDYHAGQIFIPHRLLAVNDALLAVRRAVPSFYDGRMLLSYPHRCIIEAVVHTLSVLFHACLLVRPDVE